MARLLCVYGGSLRMISGQERRCAPLCPVRVAVRPCVRSVRGRGAGASMGIAWVGLLCTGISGPGDAVAFNPRG